MSILKSRFSLKTWIVNLLEKSSPHMRGMAALR
jgi:hypothetical protein